MDIQLLNRTTQITGILLLIFVGSQAFVAVNAYSPTYGIELGDTVTMSYVGTKENGDVFDQNDAATFEIDRQKLIPGFVDGVLGMKIGERKKFEVPPARGYQTGELAGISLFFDVKILSVAGYDPNATEEVDDSFSRTVIGVSTAVLVLIFGAFGYAMLKNNLMPSLTKCIACGDAYEGVCDNCGAAFCRADFGRRCRECGHKTFIPRK